MDKKEFPTVLLLVSVVYLGFYFPQPLLAGMAETLHVSDASAGLVVTVLILPFALAPFVYGHVLKKIGLRKLLFLLMPASALLLILPRCHPTYWFLLLCRMLQGMTMPGILMCLSAHTAIRYEGQTLQRAMALYSTAIVLNAFIGRILAGGIATRLDWQDTFTIFGLIQLAACIPMFLAIGDARERNDARDDFGIRDVLSVLTNRSFLPILLIAPLTMVCTSSFNAVIPFHLHKMDPTLTTFAIGLVFFGAFLGGLAGFASRWLLRMCGGEWNTVLVGITVVIVSMQAAWIPDYLAVFVGMVFCAVGFSMMNSTILGIVNRVTPYPKGLTNSTYLATYYLLTTFSTYVPLGVYSNHGFLWYDIIVVAAFLVNVLIVLHERRTCPMP